MTIGTLHSQRSLQNAKSFNTFLSVLVSLCELQSFCLYCKHIQNICETNCLRIVTDGVVPGTLNLSEEHMRCILRLAWELSFDRCKGLKKAKAVKAMLMIKHVFIKKNWYKYVDLYYEVWGQVKGWTLCVLQLRAEWIIVDDISGVIILCSEEGKNSFVE